MKRLLVKNETDGLRDLVYEMLKEIQEKLNQGYKIKHIYKTYEKDDEFPFYINIEFDNEDDE